jgi:hypothetical protein
LNTSNPSFFYRRAAGSELHLQNEYGDGYYVYTGTGTGTGTSTGAAGGQGGVEERSAEGGGLAALVSGLEGVVLAVDADGDAAGGGEYSLLTSSGYSILLYFVNITLIMVGPSIKPRAANGVRMKWALHFLVS